MALSPFQAGLLKFLGIEEKTCDVLTGEFCNEEQLPGCEWNSAVLVVVPPIAGRGS